MRFLTLSWKIYKTEIVIGFGGLVVLNLIFIAAAYRQSTTVNPELAGQLGDFVGGYIGTLFSLIGVVLLYSTLKNQQATSKRQFFESKYFELIKLHRDNVAELKLARASGRKFFVLALREFRCTHDAIRTVLLDLPPHSQRDIMHLTYHCWYFGVGPNSSRILLNSLAGFDESVISAAEKKLSDRRFKEHIQLDRNFKFVPFEGHQSRLGHYYRHLYQMVRYVDNQDLPSEVKYEYVKTVRAQLSTHEQALLLVNSLSPMGADWWKRDLILRYKLVQNLPRNFFDSETELDLSPIFPRGYFEWEDP